jgi:hypothetical protein
MDSEKPLTEARAILEARAKLIGGEPTAEVLSFLQSNGLGEKQAAALMADWKRERSDTIRAIGIRNMVVGCLLACGVPAGFVFGNLFGFSRFTGGQIALLLIFAGLYGVWKFFGGVRLLIAPQSEKGSIAHLEE